MGSFDYYAEPDVIKRLRKSSEAPNVRVTLEQKKKG